MLVPRRAQISKQLSDVFISQSRAGFYFHHQSVLHHQISQIITKHNPVLIPDLQRMLLQDC